MSRWRLGDGHTTGLVGSVTAPGGPGHAPTPGAAAGMPQIVSVRAL